MFMYHSYSAVGNNVYSKIQWCMSYQYIFQEKIVSGKSGQFLFCDKIFPDERFYPTNTREFKKSEVEEKMASNNSLGNRALLDMKYYKISPGRLCFISH